MFIALQTTTERRNYINITLGSIKDMMSIISGNFHESTELRKAKYI